MVGRWRLSLLEIVLYNYNIWIDDPMVGRWRLSLLEIILCNYRIFLKIIIIGGRENDR